MLPFQALSPEMYPRLKPWYFHYGENSCQHSFVSSFCMGGKYGDKVCVSEGFLFTLRSLRCTDRERVYLFPLGDTQEDAPLAGAVEKVLQDAHAYGKSVCFKTMTLASFRKLDRLFPGAFAAEENRDLAEYLYTREKLAELPGHEMASRRHEVSAFLRVYGDRYSVHLIGEKDIETVKVFQKWWMEQKTEHEEDVQLELENEAIQTGLEHFSRLGLSGIVAEVDGKIAGYAYGAPLSESCYDVMIEKGDRTVADIYRMLNRDLVRLCCDGYRYINREEDLGVPGLRKAKLSYKPDVLLEKVVVREKAVVEESETA